MTKTNKEVTVDPPTWQKDPNYERWRLTIFFITWLGYVGF